VGEEKSLRRVRVVFTGISRGGGVALGLDRGQRKKGHEKNKHTRHRRWMKGRYERRRGVRVWKHAGDRKRVSNRRFILGRRKGAPRCKRMNATGKRHRLTPGKTHIEGGRGPIGETFKKRKRIKVRRTGKAGIIKSRDEPSPQELHGSSQP